MSSRHVESHVPQNSRVTPARITELFWGSETWPTACLLVILKHLIWNHIFLMAATLNGYVMRKVPDRLSRDRVQPVRQPNTTQTTRKHEETCCLRAFLTGRSADTPNVCVFKLMTQSTFPGRWSKSAMVYQLFLFVTPPVRGCNPLVINQPHTKESGNKKHSL